MSRKNIPSSWNSNVFLIIASFIVFDFAGGIYLYFNRGFSVFDQYALLFHIVIGLSLIAPLAIYIFNHFNDIRNKKNFRGKVVGILSFIVITIACATGTYQTFVGFEKDRYWISSAHTWTGFAGVLAVAHITTAWIDNRWITDRKESITSESSPGTFVPGKVLIISSTSCLAIFLIVALLSATYTGI